LPGWDSLGVLWLFAGVEILLVGREELLTAKVAKKIRKVRKEQPEPLTAEVAEERPRRTLRRTSGVVRTTGSGVRYSVFAVPSSEKALISQIRRIAGATRQKQAGKARPALAEGRARPTFARIIAGIGDDCAVLGLAPGHDSLVTTDFSLEGIHFRRDWHTAESVGHRCLARGLSDIAAMGGVPVAAFLSLALPRDVAQAWVTSFVRGLTRLAGKYGVTLAGGDTAESPGGILADIVVLGSVPKGKAVLRSGARPGDSIYVSGALGGSAAAVAQLTAGKKASARVFRRHFYPEPRIELGVALRGLASAMIDTSDGLSTDLTHICEESGVGAEVEAGLVPRARVSRREVDLDRSLHGGEDYELLFTAAPARRIPARIAGVTVTRIGRLTRGRKILLRDATGQVFEFAARGWEHFSR
jgi:thiamine-monophosphate kinase